MRINFASTQLANKFYQFGKVICVSSKAWNTTFIFLGGTVHRVRIDNLTTVINCIIFKIYLFKKKKGDSKTELNLYVIVIDNVFQTYEYFYVILILLSSKIRSNAMLSHICHFFVVPTVKLIPHNFSISKKGTLS